MSDFSDTKMLHKNFDFIDTVVGPSGACAQVSLGRKCSEDPRMLKLIKYLGVVNTKENFVAGKTSLCFENWAQITKDKVVLNFITGVATRVF